MLVSVSPRPFLDDRPTNASLKGVGSTCARILSIVASSEMIRWSSPAGRSILHTRMGAEDARANARARERGILYTFAILLEGSPRPRPPYAFAPPPPFLRAAVAAAAAAACALATPSS
jgi:hypothetical protein